MSIQAAEFSISHHDALKRVHIQRMSIQVAGSSIAHHTEFENICIQHCLMHPWSITTYYVTFIVE